MITDCTYHVQQKIPDVRYGSSDHGRVAAEPRIEAAKSDARSRLGQLSGGTLRRVAIYAAGGMVARGAMILVSNVGSEQHGWWCWLLPTCLAGLAGALLGLAIPGARRHSDSEESS